MSRIEGVIVKVDLEVSKCDKWQIYMVVSVRIVKSSDAIRV